MVFTLYALVYMTKNCYSAAMASIVAAGVMTKSQTGFIAAMFYLVYAPFQLIGGYAADKISPYKLILLGTLGGGVANTLIYFFAENYVAMLIIWSANAIVQFGLWPSVFKIITTELCEAHRDTAVFCITLSSTAGLFISYAVAVFIGNWKYNFLLSAIVLFSLTVIFFFSYRGIAKNMVEVEPEAIRVKKKREKSIFPMLIKSGVPIFALLYMIQSMLNAGLKGIVPVMLMESYSGVNDSVANALNIILVLASPVGALLAAAPFLQKAKSHTMIVAFFAASLPMVIIMCFIGKVKIAVAVAALAVLMVVMAAQSIYFFKISRSFDALNAVGLVAGIFNCAASFGIMASNVGFTRISEIWGWDVTTLTCLILVGVGIILSLIVIP
ncbi:MAG: MFS transporter, partial [Clostridia bacterium]|nr:MFS transporter [Clostridia bacterium]